MWMKMLFVRGEDVRATMRKVLACVLYCCVGEMCDIA